MRPSGPGPRGPHPWDPQALVCMQATGPFHAGLAIAAVSADYLPGISGLVCMLATGLPRQTWRPHLRPYCARRLLSPSTTCPTHFRPCVHAGYWPFQADLAKIVPSNSMPSPQAASQRSKPSQPRPKAAHRQLTQHGQLACSPACRPFLLQHQATRPSDPAPRAPNP